MSSKKRRKEIKSILPAYGSSEEIQEKIGIQGDIQKRKDEVCKETIICENEEFTQNLYAENFQTEVVKDKTLHRSGEEALRYDYFHVYFSSKYHLSSHKDHLQRDLVCSFEI